MRPIYPGSAGSMATLVAKIAPIQARRAPVATLVAKTPREQGCLCRRCLPDGAEIPMPCLPPPSLDSKTKLRCRKLYAHGRYVAGFPLMLYDGTLDAYTLVTCTGCHATSYLHKVGNPTTSKGRHRLIRCVCCATKFAMKGNAIERTSFDDSPRADFAGHW